MSENEDEGENTAGGEESSPEELTEESVTQDENGGSDEADWGDALQEQAETEVESDALARAEFKDLNASASGGAADDDINLDILLDVPVTIAMEIGRTKINIRNLLHLNQGSVIELDRLAGEPMDVLVNGTLIAHGEVVVVNDKFGIRLTDVISPSERVKKLR